MATLNQLSGEWEQISHTAFWRLFLEEIMKRRKLASRECETREDVKKAQGAITELDFILGKNEQQPLAERLLLSILEKSDIKGEK